MILRASSTREEASGRLENTDVVVVFPMTTEDGPTTKASHLPEEEKTNAKITDARDVFMLMRVQGCRFGLIGMAGVWCRVYEEALGEDLWKTFVVLEKKRWKIPFFACSLRAPVCVTKGPRDLLSGS